jgi:alcohol dehydrogenase class IV
VLRVLGGSIDDYFGTGLVTEALRKTGKRLTPHLAIQTASSSAAHLTKYSNITDIHTGQKKLIVDEAIVPPRAAYDYEVSFGAPASLTADGALDGFSHSLEVLYGAVDKPYYGLMQDVARETFRLVLGYLPRVLDNPRDREGREALALATDLGGYAIMLGGTNGAHLTSFSLVDILSHGRACILMNPYYTVFYAPAVTEPLRLAGAMLAEAGTAPASVVELSGREAGLAVADGIRAFEKRVRVPTTLSEVKGFTDAHIERALAAAKNPQLRMKLQNMPVPLTPELVDDYMGPVLEAAKTGDLSLIKNLAVAQQA